MTRHAFWLPLGAAALVVAAATATTSGAGQTAQPEFTTIKADFIPGEKTIFFDDFSDMTADDAPPHLKVRGAAPELRASGALKQLTVTANGSLFPNLTALPANFTYEAEIKYEVPRGSASTYLIFSSKDKEALTLAVIVGPQTADAVLDVKMPKYEELGRKRIAVDVKSPVKIGLWIQNGRARVFLNGEKALDVNQVALPALDKVEIRTQLSVAGVTAGYRSIRIAESAPTFGEVMAAAGRYVSHGILFDTDSDRLKPESAAVIQSIARALETNPALKLRIEGHTDAVGDAAHNLDLSKRRAEAVKAVLVGQFRVDAARLTAVGLGVTKPIETNDTPQGRAQNRRVEFVKQ